VNGLPFAVVELDHIGIAVGELEQAPLAGLLGAPAELTTMPSGVAVGRFGPNMAVEVVAAARPGSPIERFLDRRGPGLHHIAFRVDAPLEELVPQLEAAGFGVVGEIEPSSDGRPCLFVHPSSTGGVLVELVEGPRPG
jgi:methylmalonyl-CoA epimerase